MFNCISLKKGCLRYYSYGTPVDVLEGVRTMRYISTRGGGGGFDSAEVIVQGIAADGGLFVPEEKVKISIDFIEGISKLNYRDRALKILRPYLSDFSVEEIGQCVEKAYTDDKFESDTIVPLHKLNDNVHVLEIWHGPTCAFKDIALQILPHLLVISLEKTGEKKEIVILVATSGDTGKAALEGFKDVSGTRIIVFYPEKGISEVQRLQMITQEGKNVCAVGVDGNFDDAQNGVKEIFTDEGLIEELSGKGFKFSSANSINWGRLVPQTVYYFSAYAELLKAGEIKQGEKINFIVPTGNFGNILAGYYAMGMGLPVNKLVCASNDNNVLTDFIMTGVYDGKRRFKRTISPSMDILISSNLERLLFEVTNHDSVRINEWMAALRNTGKYAVDGETLKKIQDIFWADFACEKETRETIKDIYNDYGYVVDTHTAVAIDVYDKYVISTGDMAKTVILSTASPFKFNESVVGAIFGEKEIGGKSEFELLDVLADKCGLRIPLSLNGLERKLALHSMVCQKDRMKDVVKKILFSY